MCRQQSDWPTWERRHILVLDQSPSRGQQPHKYKSKMSLSVGNKKREKDKLEKVTCKSDHIYLFNQSLYKVCMTNVQLLNNEGLPYQSSAVVVENKTYHTISSKKECLLLQLTMCTFLNATNPFGSEWQLLKFKKFRTSKLQEPHDFLRERASRARCAAPMWVASHFVSALTQKKLEESLWMVGCSYATLLLYDMAHIQPKIAILLSQLSSSDLLLSISRYWYILQSRHAAITQSSPALNALLEMLAL